MGFLKTLLSPEMTVSIAPNRVTVHSPKHQRSGSADAPFSCGAALVADANILEDALRRALVDVATSGWVFPRVAVSVPGREVHSIEAQAIRDAMSNAGASEVDMTGVKICGDCQSTLEAYLKAVKAKR